MAAKTATKTKTATVPAPPVADPVTTTAFDAEMLGAIDFEQYEAGEEEARTPYCQLLTPKDRQLPHGILIPAAQADAAGFVPDANWKMHTTFMGNSEEEVTGYLSTNVRVVTLYFCAKEVYRNTSKGQMCLGRKWASNPSGDAVLTEAGEIEKQTNDGLKVFSANRSLIFFVNEKNELMSEKPFQFKMRTSIGGSFREELRLSRRVFKDVWKTAAGKPLAKEDAPLIVMPFELGLRKSAKGSLVCHASSVVHATVKAADLEATLTEERNPNDAYNVEISHASLASLFIDKYSHAGTAIRKAYDEHSAFTTPPNMRGKKQGDQPQESDGMEEEVAKPMGLAGNERFKEVTGHLDRANGAEQVKAWSEWALAPKQAQQFGQYSDYEETIKELAQKALDSLPFA